MSPLLLWLIILLVFFILLPFVALCAVTAIRYIYRRVRKRKTFSIQKFIVVLLITIIGLAVIPPLPFIISEARQGDIVLTGNLASIEYDKDNPNIRHIYDKSTGKSYQEFETSISDVEYFDYSEEVDLEYGEPIANTVFDNQSLLGKYVQNVFKYPVNSQLIYLVEKEGMENYISLEQTYLFCQTDSIDEKINYYRDTKNYDYFVEDYNSGEFHELAIDDDSIQEIRELAYLKNDYEYEDTEESILKAIPNAISLDVESDYDMMTVIGESKDKFMLREIGTVYTDNDGKMYQVIEEIWEDDGSVALLVLTLSDKTTNILTTSFKNAGIQ